MADWKEYKLGELTTLITKGTTPTTLGGGFCDKGINFIKSEAVSYDGRIDKSTFVFIDKSIHEKLKRSQLVKDDILFSMAGIYLGKNAIVSEDILPANTNQALAIIRLNKDKVIPKYIHYYLRQKSVIDFVNTMSGQSAQPNINFEEIKSIEVKLPDFNTQRIIASILGSLDDKIDIFHRQNKTLKALAKTTFRQWFGESENLKMKSEKLGNVIEFLKGRKPNQIFESYFEGSIPQLLIESFDTGKTFFTEPNGLVLAKEKDILMVMDGASSGRVEIGYTGAVGSTIGLFRPKNDFDFPLFLFHFLKSNEDQIKENTTGSAIPHADKALILNLDFLYTDKKEISEFEKMAATWFEKIKLNRNQIRTLTKLRDTILPKLMSGEVRVKI